MCIDLMPREVFRTQITIAEGRLNNIFFFYLNEEMMMM